MKTINDIRNKTELFFRDTLKLAEINKRNGTINCGRCFMRLDDYIREGMAPDNAKAVGTQPAQIFTHPDYELQAGGALKILRSFTKDKRLLKRCAPLRNHTYKLSLGNGEAIEIIDLTVAPEPAALDQLPLQRVDTAEGQELLIATLKDLPRREKDGTAYGCIILTWPSKEAHMLNFFVTSRDDLSQVFFIDAQVGSLSDTVSTEALPDIYFLQSMPPEGFELKIKKEPVECKEKEESNSTLKLTSLKSDLPEALEMPQLEMPQLEVHQLEVHQLEMSLHGDRALNGVIDILYDLIEHNTSYNEVSAIARPILNRFFSSFGPQAGRAVVDVLLDSDNGKKLLFAKNQALMQELSLETLNTTVPSVGKSVLESVGESIANFLMEIEKRKDHSQTIAPYTRKRVSIPASDAEREAVITLFKTQYSHLKGSAFYKIWCNQHGGKRSYGWVLDQLQHEGLLPRKGMLFPQIPASPAQYVYPTEELYKFNSGILFSSAYAPPLPSAPLWPVNGRDNEQESEPDFKKNRVT